MKNPVFKVFKLILRVSLKLIPDMFYKNPKIVPIFARKDFEFFPKYKIIETFFDCMAAFVLCPISANFISKKKGHKKGAIVFIGFNCIKIIFLLVTKLIVI